MKKTKTRILSLVLALVMAVSQFAGVNVVMAAEQIDPEGGILASSNISQPIEEEPADTQLEESVGVQEGESVGSDTDQPIEDKSGNEPGDYLTGDVDTSQPVEKKTETSPENEPIEDADITQSIEENLGDADENGVQSESEITPQEMPSAEEVSAQSEDGMSGNCGDATNDGAESSVTWELTGNEGDYTLTIRGNGAMADYNSSDSYPWSSKNLSITKIVIDGQVTTIGKRAFSSFLKLTEVKISSTSFTTINDFAFSNCSKLTKIVLPDNGLTTIGKQAFYRCTVLSDISMPSTLTTIGERAFYSCDALESVNLPDGVNTIGIYAFYSCANLSSVSLPSKLTTIGENTFCNCYALTEITLPKGLTTIDLKAFYSCSSLAKITLPEGLTTIGESTFNYCSALTEITLPSSLGSIGDNAFANSGLTTVHAEALDEPFTLTRSNCFPSGKKQNIYVKANLVKAFKGAYVWRDHNILVTDEAKAAEVQTIVETALKSISVSNATDQAALKSELEKAVNNALSANGLSTDDVTITIENFDQTEATTEGPGNISGTVKITCGTQTFEWPGGCFDKIIPQKIGGNCGAADNADGAASVKWELTGEEGNYTLTISGSGRMADYTSSSNTPWSTYKNSITKLVVEDGVTGIGAHACAAFSTLNEVSLPSRLDVIGESAFSLCKQLKEIELPSGPTEIKENTFASCDNLTKIVLPEEVVTIGEMAFWRCPLLKEITLPDNLTTIGSKAFKDCSSLAQVNFPDNLVTIGENAFTNCVGLNEIVLPSNLSKLSNIAFMGCTGLKRVVMPEGLSENGSNVFEGCTSLNQVVLPEGFTTISTGTFFGCTDLTEITLPSSLTLIGYRAFKKGGLTTIHAEALNAPVSVDKTAFEEMVNSGKLDIYVKYSLVSDFENAEVWKEHNIIAAKPTDAEKAAIAKAAVEAAVQDIKVSKDTTSESLKSAMTQVVGAVFEDAKIDIGTLSITIEGFTNTPATTADEGSINATIKITSGNASEQVDFSKQLPTIKAGNCGAEDNDGGAASVKWELTENADGDGYTLTINGQGKMKDYDTSEIAPWLDYDGISITEVVVGEGVTYIGSYSFWKMSVTGTDISRLDRLTLPDSLAEIGSFAINDCIGLQEVKLPENLKKIGESAFERCSSLSQINLPEGLTSIGNNTFSDTVLTEVTLPSTLTTIGNYIFLGTGLTTIHAEALNAVVSLPEKALDIQTPNNTKLNIYVKRSLVTAFENADVWKEHNIIAATQMTDAEKVAAAKQAIADVLDGINVTNAATAETLADAVKEAIKEQLTEGGIDFNDITIIINPFNKNEATTEAAGDITGTIKITCGEGVAAASGEVELDKTIPQLPPVPATPEQKVAAAKAAIEAAVKTVVEKAVEGKEVTEENKNEITAQIEVTLPEAIAKALEDAGVTIDEIGTDTVDIVITPATADAEGSIDALIPVTSKEDNTVSANAEVSVKLDKISGGSQPDPDVENATNKVQEIFNGMPITNETTADDIRSALEEALGSDAADVKVEETDRVPATEDTPGSLRLKITFTIKGKPVEINITELKIEKTEPAAKTGVYVIFKDYYKLGDNSMPCYKYTGNKINPIVEVYNDGTLLIPGSDYTISYKNNTKVGTASLTVKGKKNFAGKSNVVNFNIIKADIKEDTKHPDKMTVIKNTKIAPVIINTDSGKKLTTKDYELVGDGLDKGRYTDITAAGASKTLTVKGINSYEGSSFDIDVTVVEKDAAKKLAVSVSRDFKPVYDGSALDMDALFVKGGNDAAADITVTDSADKTKVLEKGTDFYVVCTSGLTDAGTVSLTFTGMGEYTGTVKKTFKISPLKVTDNSKFSVTFDDKKEYEYNAAGTTVDKLVVRYLGDKAEEGTGGNEVARADGGSNVNDGTDNNDGQRLEAGVDYKVTYSNNKKVSGKKDASFKITFLGNYKGSAPVTKTFKIKAAKLSAGDNGNTVVTVPDKVYSKAGKAYKSTPIVTVDGVTIKASNYTVSYKWATQSAVEAVDEGAADDKSKYADGNKVTIAEGDSYAKVKVTITPKENGSYTFAEGVREIEGEYYVRKNTNAIDLSRAKVTFHDKSENQLKKLEYNGKPFYTPEGNDPNAADAASDANAVYVKVTVGGELVDPSLYDVIWTNATAKGKAVVVIRGKATASSQESGTGGSDGTARTAVGSRNQAISIKAMALKGKVQSYAEKAGEIFKKLFFR